MLGEAPDVSREAADEPTPVLDSRGTWSCKDAVKKRGQRPHKAIRRRRLPI